jgi:hypothetical protein
VKEVIMNKFFVICFLLFFASISPLLAEWEPDVNITNHDSTQDLPFCNAKSVATGDNGYVHVVWEDGRGAGGGAIRDVYYKRSTDCGTTWAEPEILMNLQSYNIKTPNVATSDSMVYVLWKAYYEPNGIYYRRSTDRGATWEPAEVLLSSATPYYYLSIDASGSNVYVVGENHSITPAQIYFIRSTDWGETWEPEIQISNNPGESPHFPCVSASGSNVHIVWEDHRNVGRDIYYRGSTDSGITWGDEIQLTGQFLQVDPCVAASGSNVHVVWTNDMSKGWNIFYKHSTDCGISWGDSINISNTGGAMFPSIAVSNSNVHVVWGDYFETNQEIYYTYSTDSGNTWGPVTRLTYAAHSSQLPRIAIGDTILHVVWQDTRDGDGEIYYKRNPTGNIGVEEKTDTRCQISDYRSKVFPNPFVSYTRILGYEQESFTLYDISGRVLGAYKGDRIGVDLSPGVYFLMPENKNTKPIRIVKVR